MTRATAAVAGLLAAARGAAADPPIDGAASLEYEAGYVHAVDAPTPDRGPDGLGLAGARLRGQLGGRRLAYRVGLDLRAGATAPAGFAYDVALYMVGVGLRLGRWSRAGITAGVGASGATGTVDDAVTLPVEASLELALGGRLRVLARGRVAWVAGAGGRQDGSRTVTFADEAEASLALRLGRRWDNWGFPASNGYYLGVAVREAQGARMLGVIVGHSLDGASR